jgi:hypothetical protein
MPLFFATPAHAQTLDEAQAALIAGQQEVAAASLDAYDTAALVASASQDVVDAQAVYDSALAAKLATAVITPAATTSVAQEQVINGTFDTASNWSNIGMGSPSTVINSNIARVYNGVLIGSYTYGFISQTGNFPSPVRQVTFSYDMSNNNNNDGNRPQADGYRVEFRTYNAAGQRLNYYNTGDRADIFPWTHFTATYNLSDDAVRWDIGFRLIDNGYWNGNFAGSLDNISLIAGVTTTIPERTTYGEAESAAVISAQTALSVAQLAYNSAVNANAIAQARLSSALAAIPGLETAVIALTPAPEPTPEPTPTPTPTTVVEQPWWAQQNWEGDTVTITAPDGWEFYSVRAWYGSPDDTTCGQDVSLVLGALMIGNHSVTVALDNGTFGDPCGGIVKVTRLTWSIVPSQPVVPPVVTPPVIEPQPQPQPIPMPSPAPAPIEIPVIIEPTPTPTPAPQPTEEPVVVPTPQPTVDPTPTTTPTEEPTPTPTQSQEPTPEPTKDVVQPLPEPEPSAAPEVQPEPQLPVDEKAAVETIANLVDVAPEDLTDKQVAALVAAANVVFETAEQGSPAYEQALEALAVAAVADDPQLPAELAVIPGAAAVLETFNALGNVGADMAPAVRDEAEKTVIASVIAAGAAVNAATGAAVSAASSAASTTSSSSTGSGSSSGGSSGGSGESSSESKTSTRRRETK